MSSGHPSPADRMPVALGQVLARVRRMARDAGHLPTGGSDGPDSEWAGDALEARFDALAVAAELDALGRATLALVAIGEVDPALGSVLGDDGVNTRTVADVLASSADDEASALAGLAAQGTLRALGFVQPVRQDDSPALSAQRWRLAEVVAAALLGAAVHDPGSRGRLRRHAPIGLPLGRDEVGRRLARFVESGDRPVVVHGPDALELLAAATGRALLVVGAADLPDIRDDAVATAFIEGRILVVDRVGDVEQPRRHTLTELLRGLPTAVIHVVGPSELGVLDGLATILVEVPRADSAVQRAAWEAALGGPDATLDGVSLVGLPVAGIAEAAGLAAELAAADGCERARREDLRESSRVVASRRLGTLAQRIDGRLGWHDLVLPESRLMLLRSLAAFLRHRELVLGEWGFGARSGRAQGLVALFAGGSGTGKTHAARVLATELDIELYRVDLATLVSKWIGETERNLDRLFTAADTAGAIIFFDEADAIFGKRSAIGDSRDRYANLETSYLLQRIEAHSGPVLLATNLLANIDDAFTRRFDIVVDFPFPEEAARRRLWAVLLPAEAPRAQDLDLDFLARSFELSGGGIRNAALAAAIVAADEGSPIAMTHLVRGVAMEYSKLGRLTLQSDFEEYYDLVRSG